MKEFIQKWILHNLGWKIFSLIMAIVLWLIFTNIEDPLTTTNYIVQVEVEHLDEYKDQNRYIEVEGEQDLDNLTLTVYFRGRSSEVERLKNRAVSSSLSMKRTEKTERMTSGRRSSI